MIVAAGRGERAGGDLPKQFRRIGGKALVAHAYDGLMAHPEVTNIVVVIAAGQEVALAAALGDRTPAGIVPGGETRRLSVLAGLDAIQGTGGTEIVLIHDAARPFVPQVVTRRLLEAVASHAGAVPALPVADTLAANGMLLGDVVDRDCLVRVQTPQAFRFDDVMAAHRAWTSAAEPTDDAQMVRANGGGVAIVEGDSLLDKITRPEDFAAAEARFGHRVFRTGMGFDVHRLVDCGKLWLGGVLIPHDKGLLGHSDADVGLHALTDAILGAIGAGDIGTHFPPSDPRWRGAPSSLFLEHAATLVERDGGRIEHVDLTIICEAPRIGPYRDAMRSRIAELLRVPERRISVKATTTERLGFAGRGEGIAAQAIATVSAFEEPE